MSDRRRGKYEGRDEKELHRRIRSMLSVPACPTDQRVLRATFEPFPPRPATVWRVARAAAWYGARVWLARLLGRLARRRLAPRAWATLPPVPCFRCGGVPEHAPPCAPYGFFGARPRLRGRKG